MENEYFDIGNHQVDRGWEAMRKTLDAEMPQRKKKHRWAFWFWVGTFQSMIILVALSGWYLFLNSNSDKKQSPPTPEQKKQPIAFLTEKGSTAGIQQIQSPNEALNPYTQTHQEEITENNPSILDNAWRYPVSYLAYFNAFPTANAVVGTVTERPIVGELLINEQPQQLPIENLSNNQVLGLKTQENLTKLPQLNPILSQNNLPVIRPKKFEIHKANPTKRPSKYSLGFSTGVQSENIPNLTGYLFGLALDWQPYRNFGLRTSVNYQYSRIKTKLGEAPVVAVDGNTYVYFTGDTSVLGKNATSNLVSQPQEVFIPIYQQHKVDIPVMAYWQPLKHFRFYSGISIGHVLKATSGEYTLTKNEVHESFDAFSRESGADNLINRYLPKWNLDYQIGFGYLMTNRFEFNIFVKNGISKQKTANYSYDSYRSWYFNPTLESISTKHPLPVLQLTGTVKF